MVRLVTDDAPVSGKELHGAQSVLLASGRRQDSRAVLFPTVESQAKAEPSCQALCGGSSVWSLEEQVVVSAQAPSAEVWLVPGQSRGREPASCLVSPCWLHTWISLALVRSACAVPVLVIAPSST